MSVKNFVPILENSNFGNAFKKQKGCHVTSTVGPNSKIFSFSLKGLWAIGPILFAKVWHGQLGG